MWNYEELPPKTDVNAWIAAMICRALGCITNLPKPFDESTEISVVQLIQMRNMLRDQFMVLVDVERPMTVGEVISWHQAAHQTLVVTS